MVTCCTLACAERGPSSSGPRRAQALEGIAQGPLEQVPIQDYFPEAADLSPVEFAEAATAR